MREYETGRERERKRGRGESMPSPVAPATDAFISVA